MASAALASRAAAATELNPMAARTSVGGVALRQVRRFLRLDRLILVDEDAIDFDEHPENSCQYKRSDEDEEDRKAFSALARLSRRHLVVHSKNSLSGPFRPIRPFNARRSFGSFAPIPARQRSRRHRPEASETPPSALSCRATREPRLTLKRLQAGFRRAGPPPPSAARRWPCRPRREADPPPGSRCRTTAPPRSVRDGLRRPDSRPVPGKKGPAPA